MCLAGTVWAALLLQRGIVPFHASAVEFEAGAVLFLGRSGAGKSSLLGALLKRGRAMLADDVAGVVLDAGGRPVALPAYPACGCVRTWWMRWAGGGRRERRSGCSRRSIGCRYPVSALRRYA